MPKWIIVLFLVFEYPNGRIDTLETTRELKLGSTQADCEQELAEVLRLVLKQPAPNLKSVTGVCRRK